MSVSMQPPLMDDPAAAGGMGGMEEASDTTSVPPLIDSRVLTQFCQAIQKYADANGFHDAAEAQIGQLRARLAKYQQLAQLCRHAVLGLPKACQQVRDELECIAVDFPSDPIACPHCRCLRCCCSDRTTAEADYQGPAQFTAALDLFAGAAFVTKSDPALRDRFIIGLVRGIEDALCYPLAYAEEAAEYFTGNPSVFPPSQLKAVMATATARFLEGDRKCDPRLPEKARKRLEELACKWMQANPVTELFRALTGPRWEGVLDTIQPMSANVGDHVTLKLCPTCVEQPVNPDTPRARSVVPPGLKVLFCPRQPAGILEYSNNQLVVQVPQGCRSGPIAIVRDFGRTLLGDIIYLLDRYACEYPVEWSYSVFSLIPMWQWAYPVAFDGPHININFIPQSATVSAFSTYGKLDANETVSPGETVTIYYQVDPPGSDQNVPVQIQASSGTLTNVGIPGAIGFTPSAPGDVSIDLNWGTLTSTVVIHVARTAR